MELTQKQLNEAAVRAINQVVGIMEFGPGGLASDMIAAALSPTGHYILIETEDYCETLTDPEVAFRKVVEYLRVRMFWSIQSWFDMAKDDIECELAQRSPQFSTEQIQDDIDKAECDEITALMQEGDQ